MAFRFLHTADVHLDSPLSTLALRDPTLPELIGGRTKADALSRAASSLMGELRAGELIRVDGSIRSRLST
jgi:hypothetical protein